MALKMPGSLPVKNQYADHMQAKPVQATTTVTQKSGAAPEVVKKDQQETLVPGVFDSNGMSISVAGSRTINLGNYESARIEVGVTVPCSPQTMNEAYNFALEWAGERLQKEVNSAKGM